MAVDAFDGSDQSSRSLDTMAWPENENHTRSAVLRAARVNAARIACAGVRCVNTPPWPIAPPRCAPGPAEPVEGRSAQVPGGMGRGPRRGRSLRQAERP